MHFPLCRKTVTDKGKVLVATLKALIGESYVGHYFHRNV